MSEQHHDHSIAFKFLIRTFITLLCLTVLTVLAAMVDFSFLNKYAGDMIDFTPLNVIVAMLIAVAKAGLVVTFFMGLKFDKKMNVAIFFANIIFVFIFFAFTLTDTKLRNIVDPDFNRKGDFESPVDKHRDDKPAEQH